MIAKSISIENPGGKSDSRATTVRALTVGGPWLVMPRESAEVVVGGNEPAEAGVSRKRRRGCGQRPAPVGR